MKPGKSLRRAGAFTLVMLALGGSITTSAVGAGGASKRLPKPAASKSDFVPGEAIVRFAPGARAAARQEARREAGASFEETLGLPRAQVVEVDGSVPAAVRRLERQPGVVYAQPNYRYEATAVEEPDDTFFDKLWGLGEPVGPEAGVYALEAWESNRGSGQVIAVLDTGVDLSHPDLVPNLWEESGTGDHGHDFVDGDADPDDFNYHGTHVAGTAAAVYENELGIAGVAPEAQIMAVRVLDGDGSGSTDDIAAGIDFAAENGASVINMSLGGPAGSGDKAMSDAIAEAGEAGTVVVVAAGNEGADNDAEPHTPCALSNPNMICVAALNQSGSLAGFSNYGEKTVDLAAPGTSILSAKTDYGSPLFEDGFEGGLGLWTSETFNGGLPWGESSSAAIGANSATDSPGGDYGFTEDPEEDGFAYSELIGTDPVDLTSRRGCRIHFRTKYEIEEFFDGFLPGAVTETAEFDGLILDGSSPGFPSSFIREEVSVSDFDGHADVHPIFAVISDEEVELDGAYVDGVRLICRDQTYVDAIATGSNYDQPASGNYIRFQGTSMATPHVAGVVALVRAAAEQAELEPSPEQNVETVLAGTSAMPSPDPDEPTATFGIADACKAIALVLETDLEAMCPASSVPEVPEPPEDEDEDEDETSSSGDSSPAPVIPPPTAASPDRLAPQTFLKRRPRKVIRTRFRRGRAVFVFRSNEQGVVFICQFDRKRARRCGPRFVRWFRPGRHVLRVRARDFAGNADRTPAVYRFRVKRLRR